jgi:hypothetical protein
MQDDSIGYGSLVHGGKCSKTEKASSITAGRAGQLLTGDVVGSCQRIFEKSPERWPRAG